MSVFSNLFSNSIEVKLSDFKLVEGEQFEENKAGKIIVADYTYYETTILIVGNKTTIKFEPSKVDIALDDMCSLITKQLSYLSNNLNEIKNKLWSDVIELAQRCSEEGKVTKETFDSQCELSCIYF